MKKKYFVIDSLARSGTTLLASLMRSQNKTDVFCPGFNESLSCGIDNWPHGFARHEILKKGNANLNLNSYKKTSIESIKNFSQFNGKRLEEYESIINSGRSTKEIIESVSNLLNIDVLGFRWNQGIFYINNWLTEENRYWITITRNPMDRAVSSHKKHKWSYSDSLINTESYSKKIEKMKSNPNFIHVYYEELVESPEKVLKYIYLKMGIQLNHVELKSVIGSNGRAFIPQPNELIGKKVDGYYKGEEFSGLYKKKINAYKNNIPQKWIEKFKDFIENSEIYNYYHE